REELTEVADFQRGGDTDLPRGPFWRCFLGWFQLRLDTSHRGPARTVAGVGTEVTADPSTGGSTAIRSRGVGLYGVTHPSGCFRAPRMEQASRRAVEWVRHRADDGRQFLP